jgi:hypothetical protein
LKEEQELEPEQLVEELVERLWYTEGELARSLGRTDTKEH